jgi:hypothetical protein
MRTATFRAAIASFVSFEVLLLPVYLSWWLHDELLRAEPATRSSS